ncbi:MAG: NAD(+) synthase [bacterium]|nr:NAD(+) synthase [bacterium]
MEFNKDVLKIDAAKVADEICQAMVEQVGGRMGKKGAVVGISGGIDSSVIVALCTRAFGPEKVFGIMMPEGESSPDSEKLARILGNQLGIETMVEDLTEGLKGLGCYEKRDEAIKSVFPEFGPGYKSRIVIPRNILDKSKFNVFELAIETPAGETKQKRMSVSAYLQIVAASNYKQRLRMTTLYYHAEKRNWAVIGTGNYDEHEQGFFVKYGDGGADIKPIAHLFKTQVFQLADYLGIPNDILDRTPTTDTYSSEVTQEDFYFGLDFYRMDMLWYAMQKNVPAEKAAEVLGITAEQAARGYENIQRKVDATMYLKLPPLHIDD